MDKPLISGPELSLKEMALRKVVINLWNDDDILASIGNPEEKCRVAVTEAVTAKASKLNLPKSLKNRIMDYVKPIGAELVRWEGFHEKILGYPVLDLNVQILKQLHWTSVGAVNYRKSAEALVSLEALGVEKRFRLACTNCLTESIPSVWQELTEKYKDFSYLKMSVFENDLEFYWAYYLKGYEHEFCSLLREKLGPNLVYHQIAFEDFALNGYIGAAEYFLKKLTNNERNKSITRAVSAAIVGFHIDSLRYNVPNVNLSNVLCYLLSLMSPEQQMQILRKYPSEVLACFLDWPWHDLFLKVADLVWATPDIDYLDLLWMINRSYANSNYYIPHLFQTFFVNSPRMFKKHFVQYEFEDGFFLVEFFVQDDAETIKIIFRNLDVEDRVNLVISLNFYKHLDSLFMAFTDKWHMVKLCLQEATLSSEDRLRMKNYFTNNLLSNDLDPLKCRRRKWKRFFEFLDEMDSTVPTKDE